jgi:hypothetical protein
MSSTPHHTRATTEPTPGQPSSGQFPLSAPMTRRGLFALGAGTAAAVALAACSKIWLIGSRSTGPPKLTISMDTTVGGGGGLALGATRRG